MNRSLAVPAIFSLLIFPAAAVHAGNGTTSLEFLLENLSARQVGMGGLSTAIPDDTGSIATNPAGLGLTSRAEANFSGASTQDQSRSLLTSYAYPLPKRSGIRSAAALALLYYSAGNLDINDLSGNTRSVKAESDFSGMVSFGARVHPLLALGITPKFIRSTLVEQYSASAFAADFGAMFFPFPKLLKERIIIGAAVQNLGNKISYKSADQDLPRTDSLALSARLWENEDYGSVLASVQGERSLGEKTRYRMGGEYSFGGKEDVRAVSIRGGYRMHFESEDFSLGIGFREQNLSLDYAFVGGIELEPTHRFTLTFKFGRFSENRNQSDRLELMTEQKEAHPEFTPKREKEILDDLIKDDKAGLTDDNGKPGDYFIIRNEMRKKKVKQ